MMNQPISDMVDKRFDPETDARTLHEAEEIKQDPARLSAAMEIVNKKAKAINSIADVEAARTDHMMKKNRSSMSGKMMQNSNGGV